MTMTIDILESKDFGKCLKKIRIHSIGEDLGVFKKAVAQEPTDLRGTFEIPRLRGLEVPVFKFKKFRCRELGKGSRSPIRVVYAYFKEDENILLIEIYKKGQQTNHNEEKIRKSIDEYLEKREKHRKDASSFM